MTVQDEHTQRMQRAKVALEALSLGDAFGERFFGEPARVKVEIAARRVPPPVWGWTDDTAMALSVVEVLESHQGIDADDLAGRFARRYRHDPTRGYGRGAHDILSQIYAGTSWRDAAGSVFGGGSMGNGAAMRVAPVGAYFAGDLNAVITHAAASAKPTHLHPDGQAGAIAVAVAAALACDNSVDAAQLVSTVIDATPDGATRDGIRIAQRLGPDCDIALAASTLGNGSNVIASDTVPFCIWSAARHLEHFEEAMWTTVSALGDRDTTCAIVAGIIANRVGEKGLPNEWMKCREVLPSAMER